MPPAAVDLVVIEDVDRDRHDFVEFVTASEYPFHVDRVVTPERAAVWFATLFDADHAPYWVMCGAERIGVAVLQDLTDDAPLFDLRLATGYRGKGLGVPVLRALTDLVFTTRPRVSRFEGNTREDNLAMRATFERAGWVQESYYRAAWPTAGGSALGAVSYAILRRDWETGITTPIVPFT